MPEPDYRSGAVRQLWSGNLTGLMEVWVRLEQPSFCLSLFVLSAAADGTGGVFFLFFSGSESRRAALTAALDSGPSRHGLQSFITFQYLLRVHRRVWGAQVAAGFPQQVGEGDGYGRHRRFASPLQHGRKLVHRLVCSRELVLWREGTNHMIGRRPVKERQKNLLSIS